MTDSSRDGGPWLTRLYGRLLFVLPDDLRRGFGSEVASLFGDMYRDARRDGGVLAALRLWIWAVSRLFACAVQARRDGGARWVGSDRSADPRNDWGWGDVMSSLLQDVRYGVRSLVKRPGFSIAAVLILATGIGATTSIFSVVDRVLLRELPYPDAGQLVHFDNGSHNYANFRTWREMSSFEIVTAARDYQVDLTGEGAPERVPAVAVSEDFFRLFGGAPYLGRLFGSDDYPGDRSVAVLSHGFWTRLGGDASLVGRTLTIDGRATSIIGVLEPRFVPPELETGSRVDVWFALDEGGADANSHGFHVLGVAARLRPGTGLDAAQAEVDAERAAIAEEMPNRYYRRDGSLVTTPLVAMHEATVRDVSSTLYMLLGAVGMMLLIACANVANLFLARGTARGREIALRGALGASRSRIAWMIFTESVMLALVGGALGIGLALLGVDLFTRFTPDGVPRIDGLAVDSRVMWFTVTVSAVTGVLFGTLPALQAMREDVHDALKDGARSVTASRSGRRIRSGLVVAEIALAVVLVAGAGLLFRSFVEMVRVEPGFDVERLVILPLELQAEYDEPERAQFVTELIASVESLPDVESVAVGWTLPFTYTGTSRCCWRTYVVGDPALLDEEDPFLSIVHPVSGGYFATLGAELRAGREFVRGDAAGAPVALLNEPAARELFGEQSPVGRTIQLRDEALEVVGVVEGVHHWGLSEDVEVGVYVPYGRYGPSQSDVRLLVRTSSSAETLAPLLRAAVWAIDPDLPVGAVTTMEARIGASLAEPRFLSGLLGGFAIVSLLLACGGIYGSMLYSVGQRRREMGIRLALGAAGSDVMGLVLRHGARLTIAGVVLGTLAGLALSRVMRSLVWGIQPDDPLTFVMTATLLGAAAIAATYLPARRASRTDPLKTLKAE